MPVQPIASVKNEQLAPRMRSDSSGFWLLASAAAQWSPNASLPEIRRSWENVADRLLERIDQHLLLPGLDIRNQCILLQSKAECLMSLGRPDEAHAALTEARRQIERHGGVARTQALATFIYLQGIAGLRQGENENCILCRGDSSCILPLAEAAVHQNPDGSRLAIKHFTEYLEHFPDDLEVRWLLNLAHMTLGEYPEQVDPRYLVRLDHYDQPEEDMGQFRDVGHVVGLNRFNQAGGAIMEDFDNDGLLDVAVSSFSLQEPLGLFRNRGDGTFEDMSERSSGLGEQGGGITCVQTDYNNDGLIDIFIPRGSWLKRPMRPSLLRNDGEFHFTDVTEEAGLLHPVNSNAAAWADYDNDGWLDLFVCCEIQQHRLYRNRGDGTFEEVAAAAGLTGDGQRMGKGCSWIDVDNDDFPDLFINYLEGRGQLYRNNRDGTFSNVSRQFGIDGPENGFSCWAWDYDNDGWQDIFATCYARTTGEVVKGLAGQPHEMPSNKLFRNVNGERFEDVARPAGLDMVFATMGSNFGDFDNDGFLDMYLGTGEPGLGMLVPNRMFKNVAGKRFAEITASARVGHLQKGHGVACGDWDRDGDVDVFIEMGGVVDGDRYHNLLFQNPGHQRSWLTLKLVGTRSNRAAVGARIKVVTDGPEPLTVHRHVSSGSSFGGNPFEQTIGLANAQRIARIEIRWPTSGTTQVIEDVAVNQCIEITELNDTYRTRAPTPIALPE